MVYRKGSRAELRKRLNEKHSGPRIKIHGGKTSEEAKVNKSGRVPYVVEKVWKQSLWWGYKW